MTENKLCPKCRISWTALAEMLKDDVDSDNYQLALVAIRNCPTCKEHFDKGG